MFIDHLDGGASDSCLSSANAIFKIKFDFLILHLALFKKISFTLKRNCETLEVLFNFSSLKTSWKVIKILFELSIHKKERNISEKGSLWLDYIFSKPSINPH